LLENGAAINAKSRSGATALHEAAKNGSEAAARLLIENRADIAAKDVSGATALPEAAKCGQEGVTRLLIKNGADIAADDASGMTALHKAASCKWSGHSCDQQRWRNRSASGKSEESQLSISDPEEPRR
jgi:ankyrin repeat protein